MSKIASFVSLAGIQLDREAALALHRAVGNATFEAVVEGRADAGVIFEPWLPSLLRRSALASDDIIELWRSRPYDHCAFTARPELDPSLCSRFVQLLLDMDPADPEIAEMMRMEHLTRTKTGFVPSQKLKLPSKPVGWNTKPLQHC